MTSTPEISRNVSLNDTILLIGATDPKLARLLERLGYATVTATAQTGLVQVFSSQVIDLIIIDSRGESDFLSLLEYLRSAESTRRIPLIALSNDVSVAERGERLERLPVDSTAAAISAKVATLLRLRKIGGAEDSNVSLAEANAALRDFTSRFRKELEEARSIQESLLPASMPVDAAFQCAAHYQPLEEVGGDWYFAERKSNGAVALQIADVTGHGLSAAFIGSMTKLAMNAAREDDPGKLLTAMNALMAPQLPEGRFVTMASVLFDPVSRSVRFARAGHPLPLLRRGSDGQTKELKSQGFGLGFFPDSEYAAAEEQLQSGDILVLYTDGISEAQNRSLQTYGVERLASSLGRVDPTLDAAAIVEHLLSDFQRFCDGRRLKDDVTVLVLKSM